MRDRRGGDKENKAAHPSSRKKSRKLSEKVSSRQIRLAPNIAILTLPPRRRAAQNHPKSAHSLSPKPPLPFPSLPSPAHQKKAQVAARGKVVIVTRKPFTSPDSLHRAHMPETPRSSAIVRVRQPADGPVARLQRRGRAAALRVRLADLCARRVRRRRGRCGCGGC